MENLKGVKFIKCDFMDSDSQKRILSVFESKIDVILSDMAANTTGNKTLDCIRTNLLGVEVINMGSKILKSNGTLIAKLFMGEDFLEVKNYHPRDNGTLQRVKRLVLLLGVTA